MIFKVSTANDIAVVELARPSKQTPVYLAGQVDIILDEGGDTPAGYGYNSGVIAGWGATGPHKTDFPDLVCSSRLMLVCTQSAASLGAPRQQFCHNVKLLHCRCMPHEYR